MAATFRYFIPATIPNRDGVIKSSFWVEHFVDQHPAFRGNMAAIRLGIRLVDAVRTAEQEDKPARIVEDDWSEFVALIKDPSEGGGSFPKFPSRGAGFIEVPIRMHHTFAEPILKATTKPPKPPKTEAEPAAESEST